MIAQTIAYPGKQHNCLYDSTYDHAGDETCDGCKLDHADQTLSPIKVEVLHVHYGTIVSGN